MSKKKGFLDCYREKLKTPEVIVSELENGSQLVTDNSMGAPTLLMQALSERLDRDKDYLVTVHTLLDVESFPLYHKAAHKRIGVSWFSGKGARRAVAHGLGDVMPCCYKDMASIFRQWIEVDAFLVMVSPMDKHGYFSTGIIGSNCDTLFHKAKRIYVEVNPHMPRVASAPLVHISSITALCESDNPLPEAEKIPLDEVSRTIGALVGQCVPDGATIQLGIGAIPNAVGDCLKCKHDLGLHTELLTDKMVELIECGAVTNQKKEIHRGRTVAAFAYGTKYLYEYLDDNPAVNILPVEYVNEPSVIGQLSNFISVNSALQVDFWGQVCAESIGSYHVSGTGGQLDYVRGAALSPGGKSFIAFPSTAKNGTVSRIVPMLDLGAIVTTNKNEVDCIVTEYGLAKLKGQTLSARTKALIAIAHPRFRQELRRKAEEMKIL